MAQPHYVITAQDVFPRLYSTWAECELAIVGQGEIKCLKFSNKAEALAYIDSLGSTINFDDEPLPSKEEKKEKKEIKDKKEIVVFIDGACKNNQNKAKAAAAYAAVFPDYPELDEARRLAGSVQTNNRAEFSALLLAHELAAKIDKITPLTIYSDSELLVNTVTKWMASWKKKGWRKANNEPVKNLDLIQLIDAIKRPYTLHHVRAHTGGSDFASVQNAKADKLAESLASTWANADAREDDDDDDFPF